MPHRERSDEALIPTSSMADIAFLLLVFFLLTATFAAGRGLDFEMASEEQATVIDPVASVLVEIGADSSLTVDGRPMPSAELLGYLEPRLRVRPDKPVIVRTAGQAPYGAMVEVLDLLRQGKAELGLERDIEIALPTEREVAAFWP